jgi:glycosyltransferase involved in cell wall biosynthesis
MAVSVVIPAYNAEAFVGEAVASVLAQTRDTFEIVVVDDGSTDATAAVATASGDPRIRCVRQENRGIAAARRTGTDHARHDLICYLDADDRLTPTALATLEDALRAQPEAVLAYADNVRIDLAGRPLTREGSLKARVRGLLPRRRRPSGDVTAAFLRENHLVNGGVAVVRKDAVIATECWRESFEVSEDWAAWVLLSTAGRFVRVPGFVALEYRVVPGGSSPTWMSKAAGYGRTVEQVFADPRIALCVPARERERLRRLRLAHAQLYIASLHVNHGDVPGSRAPFLAALRLAPLQLPQLALRYLAVLAAHRLNRA